jgi:hypothetical protein
VPRTIPCDITIGDPFFSDTTLSFITGSAGTFEEADLGLMTDFFVGAAGVFVPELSDANSFGGLSSQDLYVAVDLTEWLSFSDPFSVGGSPISVSAGTSSMLPGFLIATPMVDGSSPITFDPNFGYTVPNANRFTGNVIIGGTIDGHVVTEPGILALIAIGVAGIGFRRRPGCRRAPSASLRQGACRRRPMAYDFRLCERLSFGKWCASRTRLTMRVDGPKRG